MNNIKVPQEWLYDPEYRFNHRKYIFPLISNSYMTTAMILVSNGIIPPK